MNKQEKKVKKSNSCYDLSPEGLFEMIISKNKVGIEGYNCPKIYFDYQANRWIKKRGQILDSHRAAWPPDNWKLNEETNTKEPPKKLNYIDEQIRWANSFRDPKKSQEVMDALEAKGKKIPEYSQIKSDFDKKVNILNLRQNLLNREAQLASIREKIKAIPEYKQKAIDEVKDKIEKYEYKTNPGKSNWSKNMRVMYYADSEFLGEQIPFWNNNKKEEDKNKGEFNPNKIRLMRRYPFWQIGPKKREDFNPKNVSEFIKARDDKIEEKANAILQKMGTNRKGYSIDPVESYHKVHNHGSLPYLFRKPYDYASKEQYKASSENRKVETPSPNTYWDDGKSKVKLRKNIDDEQAQKYIMTREKTYRRLYVSGMKKSVF